MTTGTKAAPPRGRMKLDAIRSAKRTKPDRILVMGVEGVGKTTFGAEAPAPVFIAAEDGLSEFDVPAFPAPQTWTDVLDACETIATQKHDYQTLVIDTVDFCEPLIWAHLCRKHGWESIETPGYGKGYVAALHEWRTLVAVLDRIIAAGVGVILISHTEIRPFSDPRHDSDWNRYECNVHKKAASVLRAWADVCLFATYETWTEKTKESSKTKGRMSDRRVLLSQYNAAYDAKSRFDIPEELPLDFAAYAAARADAGQSQIEALKEEIDGLVGELKPSADERKKLDKWIASAKDRPRYLKKVVDGLRNKIAERTGG